MQKQGITNVKTSLETNIQKAYMLYNGDEKYIEVKTKNGQVTSLKDEKSSFITKFFQKLFRCCITYKNTHAAKVIKGLKAMYKMEELNDTARAQIKEMHDYIVKKKNKGKPQEQLQKLFIANIKKQSDVNPPPIKTTVTNDNDSRTETKTHSKDIFVQPPPTHASPKNQVPGNSNPVPPPVSTSNDVLLPWEIEQLTTEINSNCDTNSKNLPPIETATPNFHNVTDPDFITQQKAIFDEIKARNKVKQGTHSQTSKTSSNKGTSKKPLQNNNIDDLLELEKEINGDDTTTSAKKLHLLI